MSLAGVTLAAECQCCLCQWADGDVRYARRCSECKRIGLDHIEADSCLYPRYFPRPSVIEEALAKQAAAGKEALGEWD